MKERKKITTKSDWILLSILILLGVILTFVIFFKPNKAPSRFVEVSINGEVTATYSLDEDREKIITTKSGGTNTLVVHNHTVTMKDANCNDHTCIRTGTITKTGESIVCLPHRVVLTITDKKTTANSELPDAVAK